MVAGTAKAMRDLKTVFEKMNLTLEMYESFLQQVQGVNLIKEATGTDAESHVVCRTRCSNFYNLR